MLMQSDIFTGIDVGTTKIRVVVGQFHGEDEKPTIVGVGEAQSQGMRKGVVVDSQAVAQSIREAVDQAEKTSGVEISGATVSVNGSHITGMASKGVIAVNGVDSEISPEEVQRVEEAATIVQLPPNREIIHVFSRNFRLDGQEDVKNPVGMKGVRLEVDTHVITASTPNIKNVYAAFEAAGIAVHDRLLAGVASGNSVLDTQQRESGVAIVDIGSSTTNVVVHEEGDIQHVAVIPVGSTNITNDLAIGLRTEIDIAEKIKLKLSNSSDDSKLKNIKIKVGKTEHSFERSEVIDIIAARIEELFELIDHELISVGRSGKLPGGVVFVGDGSNLYGLIDFGKETLALPARVSHPQGYSGITDKIGKPGMTCAVGLMLHDTLDYSSSSQPQTGFSLSKRGRKKDKKSQSNPTAKAKSIVKKFIP